MSETNPPVPPTAADSPKVPPDPWQFRIRDLMIWTAALSVYLAAIRYFGWDAGITGVLVWACYLLWKFGSVAAREYAFGFVAIGTVVYLLLPTVDGGSRNPSRRMQCGNNLKQIGLALQNYHDTFNAFPPAYIADSTGKPMHSWRVLILPFMERKALYDKYRFGEPWDGPNNRLLAKEISPYSYDCFRCPGETNKRNLETSYVVVVGPGTVFPDDKNITMFQITDGTANTILAVEVHNSGIQWMEPRDLHVTQMAPSINSPSRQGLSSLHPEKQPTGALAVFVDGHIQFLPNDTDPA